MLFNYNSGITETYKRVGGNLPGQITNTGWKLVESLNSTKDVEYGAVVSRDLTGVVPKIGEFVETSTSKDIYGVCVKDVSSESEVNYNTNDARVIHKYFKGQPVSVMREGFIAVPVQSGFALKGEQVYVRVKPSTDNPALPIGGIEATAGIGVIAWKNVKFASDSYFPFKGTNFETTSDAPTSQVATIYVCESKYGIYPTVTTAPTAESATYGTALGDITLTGGVVKDGNKNVAGTWKMNNPQIVPNVGTYTLSATFTPNNTEKYESITNVEIVVTITKATLTLEEAPTASAVVIGSQLSTSTLSGGYVKFQEEFVQGTWAWEEPTTVVSQTGSFSAKFTPNVGAGNFEDLTTNVTVNAVSDDKTVDAMTVHGVSAVFQEGTDWKVTLPASITSVSVDDIIVTTHSQAATYEIHPTSYTGLVHGDIKIFTVTVIAEDMSHANYGLIVEID